ncbi:MAG: OsmC family protein [Anaerolineales bacterium]|jgi:ribosomal protein S12 methylthiotransferase accessory factor
MEMIVDFPGGARVDAHFGDYTVKTDQPPMGGGEGSAPTPFAVFLASVATCAGIYVLGFCKQRGLPTDGVRIVQRLYSGPMSQGLIEKIELEIQVPEGFPEKYHEALERSASMCLVKRHFENPPEFNIHTAVVAAS